MSGVRLTNIPIINILCFESPSTLVIVESLFGKTFG